MPAGPVRPLWILRCVPGVRFGRLLSAVLIFTTMMAGFAALGVFGGPHRSFSGSGAVFFSTLCAYVVPIAHWTIGRTLAAFDQLRPHLDMDEADAAAIRGRLSGLSRPAMTVSLVAANVAWVVHASALSGGSVVGMLQVATGDAIGAASVIGTALVWNLLTPVIALLAANAGTFSELVPRVRSHLLAPERHAPFGIVSVTSTLALIGVQASMPILFFNDDRAGSWVAVLPGVVATAVPMVLIAVLPVVPAWRRMAALKRAELARVDALLMATLGPDRPDPAKLAEVAPVLAWRREVASSREWPFDLGVLSRLGFYLIIPPLTWVGAALIELIIDGAFG